MSDSNGFDVGEFGQDAEAYTGLLEFLVYGVLIFTVVGIVLQAVREIPGFELDLSAAVGDTLGALWTVVSSLGSAVVEGFTGWDV